MKNKILIAIAFFSISYANAQSYFGYLNDNYAGVHSVINNPANIVDSRLDKVLALLLAWSNFL